MNTHTPSNFGAPTDLLILTPQQAEAIVRVVEAAPHVRRRPQFFVWTQSQLHALLPHQVLVCGAYQRERRELVFEAFHSIVMDPDVLAQLADAQGPLLRALLAAWVDGGGRPLMLEAAALPLAPGLADTVPLLLASGIEMLLVHGVARPQRPAEVESFFVFASRGRWATAPLLANLELLLPHLHTIWQRVIAAEREIAKPTRPLRPPPPERPARTLTTRESQILQWVREGKNNQQVADVLGISPLTVKNHVQKILRKLGANNRAHAVAEAMALGLLNGDAK